MIKLLIGGSPCTHWSIAQTKNRETAPEGIGWELFLNYLIARNKYAPDYFLYENNKSMSPSVRISYRCFAPGRCKGRVVGVKRFDPYIPAWCPKLKKNGGMKQ